MNRSAIFLIPLSLIFLGWAFLFHWTGVHQASIMRNIVTGVVSVDTISGPQLSPPWVQVSQIDTRPQRLCIDCDCRVLNCKLAQFVPSGWKEFVDREGFSYWWWSNRISFNSGSDRTYRGQDWILRGYAFEGSEFTFISVK
jgi:hypothetical protein